MRAILSNTLLEGSSDTKNWFILIPSSSSAWEELVPQQKIQIWLVQHTLYGIGVFSCRLTSHSVDFHQQMFDFITRRRLTILLLALLFVIVSILFLHRLKPSNRQYVSTSKNDQSQVSNCHETEPSDIITLCQKCTSYERRFQAEACSLTGYKEVVLCSTSNIQTARSCGIPGYVRTHQFWYFEGFVFLVALLAIASVHSRQKTLEKLLVEKIRRQIGESDEWVPEWSGSLDFRSRSSSFSLLLSVHTMVNCIFPLPWIHLQGRDREQSLLLVVNADFRYSAGTDSQKL